MALSLNNRQYPKYTTAVITDSTTDNVQIQLPPGAIVLSAASPGLVIVDAFAGTTPTITIVDNSGTPVNVIAAASSLGTVATIALAAGMANKYYPAGAVLTISFGGTVTAGSGKAIFCLGYLVENAENELYGRG